MGGFMQHMAQQKVVFSTGKWRKLRYTNNITHFNMFSFFFFLTCSVLLARFHEAAELSLSAHEKLAWMTLTLWSWPIRPILTLQVHWWTGRMMFTRAISGSGHIFCRWHCTYKHERTYTDEICVQVQSSWFTGSVKVYLFRLNRVFLAISTPV